MTRGNEIYVGSLPIIFFSPTCYPVASRSSTEERVIPGDKLVIARVAYVVVEVLTNRKELACENLGFIYVKDGVY